MDDRKAIYISGKITGTNDYMKRFSDAENKLREQGWEPINPAAVNALLPKDTSYQQYMNMAFCMLKMADTIYMMKGWRDSKGAVLEWNYAIEHGYSILYEDDE